MPYVVIGEVLGRDQGKGIEMGERGGHRERERELGPNYLVGGCRASGTGRAPGGGVSGCCACCGSCGLGLECAERGGVIWLQVVVLWCPAGGVQVA